MTNMAEITTWLHKNAKGKKKESRAKIYGCSATIYYLWHGRNALVFDDNKMPKEVLNKLILTHVHRLLNDIFPIGEREENTE